MKDEISAPTPSLPAFLGPFFMKGEKYTVSVMLKWTNFV